MNNKEKNLKLLKISERDKDWASLRDRKNELSALINNIVYRIPSSDTMDFILYFQCLRVVMQEIEIYEEENPFSDEIQKILKDKTQEGVLKRLSKETELWEYISNKNNSLKKRFEAIKNVKNIIWGYLVEEKKRIENIIEIYPNVTSNEDMSMLVQCVSIVLMELEINDIEIEMIETGDRNGIC